MSAVQVAGLLAQMESAGLGEFTGRDDELGVAVHSPEMWEEAGAQDPAGRQCPPSFACLPHLP